QLPAGRTGLARVGGIDVHDGDPHGTGLVLDEALQLLECPAVQPGAHAPTGPKAIADVGEVLHHDRGRADASGFLENRLLVSWLTCLTRRRSLPETCRSF